MATVVVVGGGYGGVPTAKALDEIADVVLVEPRDAFVHNVRAARPRRSGLDGPSLLPVRPPAAPRPGDPRPGGAGRRRCRHPQLG